MSGFDTRDPIELKQANNNAQAIITIPKDSNDLVKITYAVHQQIGNPSNVHEAIVRDDLVHAPGYGIFAIPDDLNENDKINITIKWVNLDAKWQTISSYGSDGNINLNVTTAEL